MIYIKNNTEVQTIFIPRNELEKEAYITSVKTYEDGLKEGYDNGREYQKDQLLNLYVTENGVYEREDGYGRVTIDIEGGNVDFTLEEKSERFESNGSYVITPSEGVDGMSRVNIEVAVPQEGGSCNLEDAILYPQTTDFDGDGWLYRYPTEGFNGMGRVAIYGNILRDTWYNEGYNAASAPLNLQDKWVTPSMADRDGNGYIVLYPDEGFDGLERAVINPQIVYNEGYNQGKAEGGGDGTYNVLDFQLNPDDYYWFTQKFAAQEGVSGWQEVIVRTEGAYDKMKEIGKQELRNNLKTLVVNEVGSYDINDEITEMGWTLNNAKLTGSSLTTPLESIKIRFSTFTFTEEGEWLPQQDLLQLSNGLRISYSGGGIRIEDYGNGNMAYETYPYLNEVEITQNTFSINGQIQYYDFNLFEGADYNIYIGPMTETIVSLEVNGVSMSLENFTLNQGDYRYVPQMYKKFFGEGWNRVEVALPPTRVYGTFASFKGSNVEYTPTDFYKDKYYQFNGVGYTWLVRSNNDSSPYIIENISATDLVKNDDVTEIELSVPYINNNAFSDWKGLEKLSINNYKEIKNNAFSGCSKLKEIHLKTNSSYTSWGIFTNAFNGIAENGVVYFKNVNEDTITKNFYDVFPQGWTYVLE